MRVMLNGNDFRNHFAEQELYDWFWKRYPYGVVEWETPEIVKFLEHGGKKWYGWMCQNMNFPHLYWVDLSNTMLKNADMSNTIISNVNFHKANLEGANFTGSILNNVKFTCSNLKNANFTNAVLYNINARAANITDIIWNCVSMKEVNLIGTLNE